MLVQGVEEPQHRIVEAPIAELLREAAEEVDNDPCHQVGEEGEVVEEEIIDELMKDVVVEKYMQDKQEDVEEQEEWIKIDPTWGSRNKL